MKDKIILFVLVILMVLYIGNTSFTISSNGCEYCTNPVETFSDSEKELKNWNQLYAVHKEETAVYALQRLSLDGDVDWYLCSEDNCHYDEEVEGNCPPSIATTVYWIKVSYCPWCGRKLN